VSRLELALAQLKQARRYTLRLLDHTDPAEWFKRPHEGVTHIAWQAGHLAMAEYRMALERIRGKRPEDESIIPEAFLKRFFRETTPDPDAVQNPSPDEIRAVLERVHQRVLLELPLLSDEMLDRPPRLPHPLFDTKLGSLQWCAQHEMLHAGQIGLLRRLLGHSPLW
jgi:DinB superfamily